MKSLACGSAIKNTISPNAFVCPDRKLIDLIQKRAVTEPTVTARFYMYRSLIEFFRSAY